jgi:hypothetical protein
LTGLEWTGLDLLMTRRCPELELKLLFDDTAISQPNAKTTNEGIKLIPMPSKRQKLIPACASHGAAWQSRNCFLRGFGFDGTARAEHRPVAQTLGVLPASAHRFTWQSVGYRGRHAGSCPCCWMHAGTVADPGRGSGFPGYLCSGIPGNLGFQVTSWSREIRSREI